MASISIRGVSGHNKDPMSFSARNALSVEDSRRFLAAASTWIGANLPEDVRDEHGRLFDRRMRFGLARLWVIWSNGTLNADAMADILNFGTFDRAMLGAFARIPFGSTILALGWMTLRMPPFSPGRWSPHGGGRSILGGFAEVASNARLVR